MREADTKARLLQALARRVGAAQAVGMAELFEEVYSRPVQHRINDTRALRRMITVLRLDGVPIASVSDSERGGYYLAAAGPELEDYLRRLRRRGLTALAQEARIRNIGLPELLSRLQVRPQEKSHAAG